MKLYGVMEMLSVGKLFAFAAIVVLAIGFVPMAGTKGRRLYDYHQKRRIRLQFRLLGVLSRRAVCHVSRVVLLAALHPLA